MAQYPTFEDYQKRGNYSDGVKRCDQLLVKNPNDAQLLIVKLRLLSALKHDLAPTLDRLHALQPPVQDTRAILGIEEAVVEALRDHVPRPRTAGPAMAKFYDVAMKAPRVSTEHKTNLQSLRFTTAVYDDRLADAQQALIQLKALQPGNRVLYMAHAAVTQLLSTSSDDLQARLSLSLARKAVAERFDSVAGLDCRVPGQILALQGHTSELENLPPAMRDSKQVHDALRTNALRPVHNQKSQEEQRREPRPGSVEAPGPELEALKSKFSSLILQDNLTQDALLAFAAEATTTFQKVSKAGLKGRASRSPIEACFLSVSALVKAFELSGISRYLLSAAYSAECLLKVDPHVHEARLVLVYLYVRMGLGKSAIRLFESLSIKELQHDTVGHALLTDISYTHPHTVTLSKREPFDPCKRVMAALTVYTRSEEKLAETEAGVLNHGQTGMIFDLHGLRDRLRASISRRLIFLEQRRLARLMHGTAGEESAKLGPNVLAFWIDNCDNRDFDATLNFGFNIEKALYRGGNDSSSFPDRRWLLFGLAVDTAWCLARGFETPVSDVETLRAELTNIATAIEQVRLSDQPSKPALLTTSYRLAADLACQVLALLDDLRRNVAKTQTNIDAISKALRGLEIERLMHSSDVLCESIKAYYAFLDILRVTARAVETAKEQSKEHAAALKEVHRITKQTFETLRNHCSQQAKLIQPSSVRDELAVDTVLWQQLSAFGPEQAKTFIESVVDAAREGWQGAGKIKLV